MVGCARFETAIWYAALGTCETKHHWGSSGVVLHGVLHAIMRCNGDRRLSVSAATSGNDDSSIRHYKRAVGDQRCWWKNAVGDKDNLKDDIDLSTS